MKNIVNLKYFNQPDEADKWVWRIENGVGDWVRIHQKSFWYIVLWESKRAGILMETITRIEFATLLVQECSDALSEDDTINKIVYSIEKFQYKDKLREFDKVFEASPLRKHVNEVSALLTRDVPTDPSTETFTLEGRMMEYLTTTTEKEPYAKVCFHPIYGGKTATMSVENYVSQKFWNEHRPSHTVIFQCVDETLTEEMVEMFQCRFGSLSNTKLFIASTHTFSGSVKREAELHKIGLILVNPRYKVNENSFILPRTQGSEQPDEAHWHSMLTGQEKMTELVLTYDNGRIDNTLSFILYKYASCNKNNLFITAPVLTNAEIEREAQRLAAPWIEPYVSQLERCGPEDKVPTCEIDPYRIAKDIGLTVNRGKTGPKLGHIDIGHKKVTLSSRIKDNTPRDRYSLAHEIGHNILHRRFSEIAKDGHHYIITNTKKWLEHHANYFASCLLMPAPVIRLLYGIYWKREFNGEKVFPMIVQEDFYHDPIFQHVIGPVARKMNVSLQAAFIRLKKMGIILDSTQKY